MSNIFKPITPSITELKTGTPIIKCGDKYIVAGIGGDFIPGGSTATSIAALEVNATGLLSERYKYDSEPKDFIFLAMDNGCVYAKQSDATGDWSDPASFRGETGPKGEPGEALEGNYIDVDTVSDGFLVIPDTTIPVAVEIASVIYPTSRVVKDNSTFRIPTEPILAMANLESYEGVWRVWCAGGKRGEDGTAGGTFPIMLVDELPENPDPTTLYLIPVG